MEGEETDMKATPETKCQRKGQKAVRERIAVGATQGGNRAAPNTPQSHLCWSELQVPPEYWLHHRCYQS